ncbi:hypothetical protein HanIR_Chr11g0520201 [Helianthus annuus]|nr:hypothetical protein HanIR_Chr11g0520201 [Helianthus annuus]
MPGVHLIRLVLRDDYVYDHAHHTFGNRGEHFTVQTGETHPGRETQSVRTLIYIYIFYGPSFGYGKIGYSVPALTRQNQLFLEFQFFLTIDYGKELNTLLN